jgi:heme-degrading monooxygenase HmoA
VTARVVGIDINPAYLEATRRRFETIPNLELHCLDLANQQVELEPVDLVVRWRNVADHEQGFRKSSQYQRWRELLHHFYDPFPTVEHFQLVHGSAMSGS